MYQKAKGWGPPPARPISTDAAAAAAGAAAAAAEPSGAAGAETGKQQEEAKRESQDEPKQEQAEQQAGEHAGSDSKASPATGDAAKEAAGQAGQGATQGVDLEAGHTTTLFFLAQVHGHAGRRDRSALYCAATLQRQLASGGYDRVLGPCVTAMLTALGAGCCGLPTAGCGRKQAVTGPCVMFVTAVTTPCSCNLTLSTPQTHCSPGAYQLSDWVQNCLQLAGYYVSASAFALAQYCLEAVRSVGLGHCWAGPVAVTHAVFESPAAQCASAYSLDAAYATSASPRAHGVDCRFAHNINPQSLYAF